MVDHWKKVSRIEDLVVLSRYWDSDDMLRNLQAEMQRLEEGLSHTIWDAQMRRVTLCPNPLPITPRFEVQESDDEVKVKVLLPQVPEDDISLSVTHSGLEVYAGLDQRACRPYFVSVEVKGMLRPDTATYKVHDGVLEVTVKKEKKVKVKVR